MLVLEYYLMTLDWFYLVLYQVASFCSMIEMS